MKYEKGSFIVIPNKAKLLGLGAGAQATYLWLCDFANTTGNCFPSRSTLAKNLGCSERAVDGYIETLTESGLVVKENRFVGNAQSSNLYYLPLAESATPLAENDTPPLAESAHELKPLLTQTNIRAERAAPVREVVKEDSDLSEVLGDSKSPRVSGNKKKAYDELISWSEHQRGFPFPPITRAKQYRAFKNANQAKISREKLMERWEEMAADKFWRGVGFDWMNVVNQCLIKP